MSFGVMGWLVAAYLAVGLATMLVSAAIPQGKEPSWSIFLFWWAHLIAAFVAAILYASGIKK